MRILVTGGAGFIGSHIVDRFLADGHEVMIVDDLSSGFRENLASASESSVASASESSVASASESSVASASESSVAEFLEASIASPEALAAVAKFQPHLVVHAAAQISVRKSMEDPAFDADVNVKAFLSLLSTLQQQEDPKPHVTFISTGGAMYGDTESIPTDEDHHVSPESLYGLHKRFGELYLDFSYRMFGLSYTVLRLANIYGPRQNPHGEAGVVAIFSERLLTGKKCRIFGDGEQTRDFLYVGDVVEAVACTAKQVELGKPEIGIFNVGTGQEVSVNTLFKTMQDVAGGDSPLEHAPLRTGEQKRSAIDATRFRNVCGWAPRENLSSGIRLTIDWFRERGD